MGQFAMAIDVAVDVSTNGAIKLESAPKPKPFIEWDWDIEHADRKSEAQADAKMHGAQPFQVDRRVLKDVVREKMGSEVGRIKFLSSGEQIAAFFSVRVLMLTSYHPHRDFSQGLCPR